MPTLPLTVTKVDYLGTDLYGVTVALRDGTTANYIVPASLATIEGVTISAVAMAVLLDNEVAARSGHHRHHRRYDPRTG